MPVKVSVNFNVLSGQAGQSEANGQVTVLGGSSVQLVCNASGQPITNTRWLNEATQEIVSDDGILRLDAIKETDRGSFICNVTDTHGRHHVKSFVVNVFGE